MAGDLEEGRRSTGCASSLLRRHRKLEQPTRVVEVPYSHASAIGKHYKGNKTTTTKYTLLTFLPKALFEQYRRVANIYFTLVAALSLTPYSPVRPWTTFLPLGIVLGVAIIKEAVEDYKRHKQDVEVNNRDVEVYDHEQQQFVVRTWKDVRVGDVIIVTKDQFFPADLLFLSAENEEGLCYIETMQLDGETNLKIKKAVDQTKHYTRDSVGRFKGSVKCEPPNSRLYQFTGNLEMLDPIDGQAKVVSISPASVLLRGCSLRNTARMYGLVVYAGHDTKIFMNSTQPPSKRSRIERTVDTIIFFMFGLLFSMCITGCIYFAWWTYRYMPMHWYLAPFNTPREYDSSQPVVVAITNFITAFILYGYLIPISLYVSIEMVKIVQSLVFIGMDKDMYYADNDTPAVARTSNLNEELGMVEAVLSDKTGTLTRNVMEFFKCSIGGVAYGCGVTEIERANAERRGVTLEVADADGDNPYREPFFNFYDERLMELAWANQPNRELTSEFFRLLALCHTVIPDGPADPHKIRYEAESPDEAALVVAAKAFGFFFCKRTSTQVTVRERLPEGTFETTYEVLNVLEFNSTRKRMSIIFKATDANGKDKYVLYCKGADTVIYERLDPHHPLNEQLKDVTLQHMEDFGSAGLRTLCLAYTELDKDFYDKWQDRYIAAKTSLVDREAKLDEVSEEVEKGLKLLGCTAIEDKLQEGVPQCIRTLAHAGIRLWVLTGDKVETAVNIGYACSLITDDMTQFHLSGYLPEVEQLEAEHKLEEATRIASERMETQLDKVEREIRKDTAEKAQTQYALVIDGKALIYTLSPRLRDKFLRVGLKCSAVLCCRVSPLQKAQVTALVKGHGSVTLAIGDGANDVGMIQKAHIGVGISGQEGMQAVMASDFAIAQFRFLTPLLLVHGRLSYKRITRMINFFFYKNLLFGTTIFVYNAFALFSGQPIYNDFYMTLFNVVFTAAAPLVVGWFDRDLDKEYGIKYPQLYKEGQQNLYFNIRSILGWLATAFLHATIIMAMVMVGSDPLEVDRPNGQTWSLLANGVLMFSIVVITVHLQLALVIDQWMWMHHVAIWGSIALWFIFLVAYGAFPIEWSTDLHDLFVGVVSNSVVFWLMVIVVPICCVLPVFFWREFRRLRWPQRYQIVQEIAARVRKGETVTDEDASVPSGGRMKAATIRQMFERATRLVTRKAIRHQSSHYTEHGTRRYAGFVPPYDSHSRVLESCELQVAASQAGYYVSNTGEVELEPGPTPLAARTSASGLPHSLSTAGTHGSLVEAVPQIAAEGSVSSYSTNPVLLQLEREFSKDPRRHRREGSKSISCLSMPSLPRIKSSNLRNSKGSKSVIADSPSAPPGSPCIAVPMDLGPNSQGSSPAALGSSLPGSTPTQDWPQQQQQQLGPLGPAGVSPPGAQGVPGRSPSPSRLGLLRGGDSPRASARMEEGAVRPQAAAGAAAANVEGAAEEQQHQRQPSSMEVMNEDPVMQDLYTNALQPGRRTLPRD